MFILDDEEVYAMTKKRRYSTQCQELRMLGVPFKERTDGSPVVTRDAVNYSMGIHADKAEEKATIRFEAVNG